MCDSSLVVRQLHRLDLAVKQWLKMHAPAIFKTNQRNWKLKSEDFRAEWRKISQKISTPTHSVKRLSRPRHSRNEGKMKHCEKIFRFQHFSLAFPANKFFQAKRKMDKILQNSFSIPYILILKVSQRFWRHAVLELDPTR